MVFILLIHYVYISFDYWNIEVAGVVVLKCCVSSKARDCLSIWHMSSHSVTAALSHLKLPKEKPHLVCLSPCILLVQTFRRCRHRPYPASGPSKWSPPLLTPVGELERRSRFYFYELEKGLRLMCFDCSLPLWSSGLLRNAHRGEAQKKELRGRRAPTCRCSRCGRQNS